MRSRVTAIAIFFCTALVWPSSRADEEQRSLDPMESIVIYYPQEGAVERTPVTFSATINIRPGRVDQFTSQYHDKHLCVETRDLHSTELVARSCSRIGVSALSLQLDKLGNFSTISYIANDPETEVSSADRYRQSNTVTFSVVSDQDFFAYVAAQIREKGREYPDFDLDIIPWAAQLQHQPSAWALDQLSQDHDVFASHTEKETFDQENSGADDLTLVVGIKTAVATNFPIRQSIRSTWASKNMLPNGVKVFFLGCRPSVAAQSFEKSDGREEIHSRQLWDAIQLEKLAYGDLLTDELDCDDTYTGLANKVKEFLHFTVARYSHAQYVMIADDDLYVHMDEVVRKLTREAPNQNFYSGQVRAIENAQAEKPNRLRGKFRYTLSKLQYPFSDLPPFAIGAYFFLSMDCARFIAKNRRRLQDLDGMDDMSMALWLMTTQVHPKSFGKLEHLRGGPCSDNLVALGDLSPLSIRVAHDNVLAQRRLCHEFNLYTWLKPIKLSPPDNLVKMPRFLESLKFEFFLQDWTATNGIVITAAISTASHAGIKTTYFSSRETLLNFLRRTCVQIRLHLSGAVGALSCAKIGKHIQADLQAYYKEIAMMRAVEPSRMELWRYNLFLQDIDAPPLITAYAPSAWYSRVMLECLFVAMFEGQNRPLLVVPEHVLHEHYRASPEVFVFGVLGGKCNPVSKPECQEMVASYFQQYVDFSNSGSGTTHKTQLIMLASEAWGTDGLDDRVLLLSALANANRRKHLHLSFASASFAERLDYSPLSLLSAAALEGEHFKTRFCAYLYARCEQSDREMMYDTLNALRPVDALGKCAGSSRPPDTTKDASRNSPWYNDDAVRQFAPYKFVIAFENSRAAGYVTEKIVNAFLAGSVPVYWGNSTTVSQLFNAESFIDCGRFYSLQECAEYVLSVDDSPEIYERMRRASPVTNLPAFNEAFSWHPSVPSRFLADQVLKQFLI